MTTFIKKILPYLFASICVIVIWKLLTMTDNYAWFPEGKNLLMLDIALGIIFYYKTFFWLVVTNLTVFGIRKLINNDFKTTIFVAITTTLFYFIVGQFVDKECAKQYYTVFLNQSVSEGNIDRPILEAGYQIGPIVTENIADKEMENRRYAIGGLEKIKYKPATQTIAKILLDKSEKDVFRADAYQALWSFDTEKTRKILMDFRNQATDSTDIEVIKLGEYFIKNN